MKKQYQNGKSHSLLLPLVFSHAILSYMEKISNIILVGSGKGGVGKSTICLHLALALQKIGLKTAILDADIYGPSLPTLTGLEKKPSIDKHKRFLPLLYEGIEILSFGWLIDKNAPPVWRGPMVHKALTRMLLQTAWSRKDVLFIDMPPGTGDVPLTLHRLFQEEPKSRVSAITVTGQHVLSLADVSRYLQMLVMLRIQSLGMIANMVNPMWKTQEILWKKLVEKNPLLGTIPLDAKMAIIPASFKTLTPPLISIAERLRKDHFS